ncbi:hypothetical protein L917_20756, partial [Phytophthora nicotianae]
MAKMKSTAATGSKQRAIKGVVEDVCRKQICGKGQVEEDQKLLKNSTM